MLSDLDSEKSLVYAIAYTPRSRSKIFKEVFEMDFMDTVFRASFIQAKDIWQKGGNLDNPNIQSRICDAKNPSIVKWVDAIRNVKECAYRRRVHELSLSLQQYSVNPNCTHQEIRNKVSEIFNFHQKEISSKVKITSLSDATDGLVQKITDSKSHKYVSWGYPQLDFARLEPGVLAVVAARPGVGKTAFATNCILAMHKNQVSTGLICIEMDEKQIANRCLSQDSGYSYDDIRYQFKNLKKDTIERSIGRIKKVNCYLHCGKSVSFADIQEVSTAWKRYGVQIVFIDYLQLINHQGNKDRFLSVGETSKQLKLLARSLEIPIVLLAQLNRQAADSRPRTQHLKESGQIEENADIIVMLDRQTTDEPMSHEYYRKSEIGQNYKVDLSIHAAVLVEKNRNGRLGSFFPVFEREAMTFS